MLCEVVSKLNSADLARCRDGMKRLKESFNGWGTVPQPVQIVLSTVNNVTFNPAATL
jgi:hypothetical protein